MSCACSSLVPARDRRDPAPRPALQSVDDLKKLNKNKKLVKKLAKKFDAFLASGTLIKQIPRLLGPGLNRAGKFPALVGNNDPLDDKVEEQKAQVSDGPGRGRARVPRKGAGLLVVGAPPVPSGQHSTSRACDSDATHRSSLR